MSGIAVHVCTGCSHVVFPRLLVCSRCGSGEWREEHVDGGVVERVTRVRQGPIEHQVWTALGTVRTEAGPVVVARLEGGPVEPGDEVRLERAEGAVVARAAHRART